MTLRSTSHVIAVLVGMVIAGSASAASAQGGALPDDPLTRAKSLYASAAYEDALSLLNGLALADAQAAEAAQYRAFCLIALGRTEDATRAIETVVIEDPTFVPSATDLSPRVLALFTETRRKLLPTVLLRLYREAREAFDAKIHEQSVRRFEQVLKLAEDPDVRDVEDIADLRVLAKGFADLSRAAIAPPAPPAPVASVSGAQPAPAPVARVFRDPVVVRQDLPRWTPASVDRGREFEGLVRVVIGVNGSVQAAEIVESIHPAYDELVLLAARRWTYMPATEGGVPVETTKVINVRLFPPE